MKLKHIVFVWLSVLLAFACPGSEATTNLIDFDDLGDATGTSGIQVTNGYGNSHFTWDNFYVVDGVNEIANPSGFEAGVVSANNVAFNGAGSAATLSSSRAFTLFSAYLTAAWNDGLNLEVQGYNSGSLIYDNTFTLSATAPSLITFNYFGVDQVVLTSSGGTQNTNYSGAGVEFVMDNLVVQTFVDALNVTITPQGAIDAGAQWSIDGSDWYDSGEVLYGLAAGQHTLEFSDLAGWFEPADQIISIASGQVTSATGTYTQPGSLEVNISPLAAANGGALWSLDNTNWHSSGETLSGLEPGHYTVLFSPVASYNTPANLAVTIDSGALTAATAVYTQTGSVQVTIDPAGAVTAGAQWRVDSGAWQNSGATLNNVAPGYHTLAFKALTGWQTPTNQTFWCAATATQSLSGTYVPIGSLTVTLGPAAAVTAGARWQLGAGSWLTSGAILTNLPTGSNTVNFNVLSGWVTPASIPVTITQNTKTTTNAAFAELTGQLQIQMEGRGAISPNYSNAWLQIGSSYAVTSSPAAGFKFGSWTVSTNWAGGITTTKAVLPFTMASNLTLLATLVETSKPSLTVTAPVANQKLTNALAAVRGTASDNWELSGVWYSLNGATWTTAATTNNWAGWNTTLPLVAGTNTLKAYALDLGGNYSPTSSVSFSSPDAFQLRFLSDSSPAPGAAGASFTLLVSSNLAGQVESSTDLVNWLSWTNFKGTNSSITFRDPAATNTPLRFFRAVVP